MTAGRDLADNNVMQAKPPFTDVPGALEEFKAGRMIVVVDDEDRENEGDLTLAAEFVTPEAINFGQVWTRAHLPQFDRGAGRLPSLGPDVATEFLALRHGIYGNYRGPGGRDDRHIRVR